MIAEKLEYWGKRQPNRTALQLKTAEGFEKITYSELNDLCINAASHLRECGIHSGDHVALYGENSLAWVISYIAIHLSGGVIVPLDAQLSAKDVLPLINFSDASAVITDESCLADLKKLLSNAKKGIKLFSSEYLMKVKTASKEFKPYEYSPDKLMSIIFTSGTTGNPKGVQLTHENIFSNVQAVLNQIKITTKDNVLNILPLNHAFSCTVGLLTPIFAGAVVTFSQSLKSIDLLCTMRETGVTIFPGVPKLFTLLKNEIFKKVDNLGTAPRFIFWIFYTTSRWTRRLTGIRLGKLLFGEIHAPFGNKLRFFASGGAKLDAEVSESFLNLGFLILEGYGLTETSPVITLTPPGNPKPGSPGKPLSDIQIRIDSPNSEGVGEICVRGPNVMKGYYKNESATKEVIREGWFYTGDLGKIDSKGNITITGRSKEVIILPSGKNIYPEDVEVHYEKSPLIKEACVLPSLTQGGEVKGLKMVVVPDKKELLERKVINIRERITSTLRMIGSSLPSYMRVTELVLYYDDLPKTRLGKYKRNEIEKLSIERKKPRTEENIILTSQEKELMELPSSVRFLKRLEEVADIKGPFYPAQELSVDLGLDSLTLIEITVLMESEFGVHLSEEELSSIHTIGDILIQIKNVSSVLPSELEDISKKDLFEEPPSVPLDQMFNLNRGIVKKIIMRILQLLLSIIVRIAFRIKIEGLKKIPKRGALLLCPNHQSYIDPFLIFALMPGWLANRLFFIAFEEYFSKPPSSWMIRPWRIITTGSTTTLTESLRLCYDGLKRGMALCIFPEGSRTTTGKIMSPRLGTGILSSEANVTIVPILIDGAVNTLSPLHPEFRFARITVIVGDPIEAPAQAPHTKDIYQYVVDQWKDSIEALKKNLAAEN